MVAREEMVYPCGGGSRGMGRVMGTLLPITCAEDGAGTLRRLEALLLLLLLGAALLRVTIGCCWGWGWC